MTLFGSSQSEVQKHTCIYHLGATLLLKDFKGMQKDKYEEDKKS